MNKTFLLLLGLVALNSSIFSMENEQKSLKAKQSAQFSKMDWAKITAAGLGCAIFGGTALMTYPTAQISSDEDVSLFNIPSLIMTCPFFYSMKYLLKDDESKFASPSIYLGGVTSGLIACGLGAYVYKKISTLRSNKLPQSQKVS